MNLWIQPILQARTVEYDRHPIMNLAHESIGRRRQNRKRAALAGSASSPCIPNGGDTHNRITLQMDLEGTLSLTFRLPFIITAERKHTTLARYEFPKKGTVENRLALGVDGREFC